METLTTTAMPFPREPANYDEVSMQQSVLFSDSLKDLKNLRKQLYSAAEYFELSYSNDDQKHVVVNTLKDYAIKALVNTVDHLGSVTFKVNDLLDEKVDEVSGTELRVSSIEQRLRSCQGYIDREGLSQQSLVINTPKYHKRYILPVGEALRGLDAEDDWNQFRNAVRATITEAPSSAVVKGRSLSPSPRLSHQQPRDFSFSKTMPRRELGFFPASSCIVISFSYLAFSFRPNGVGYIFVVLCFVCSSFDGSEKRTVSPHRFPLLRTASFASRSTTPKTSRPTTPKGSRSTTPNSSRPTTPNPRRLYPAEPRKSASMRLHAEKEIPRDSDEYPSKSKRLLKALLSRRKSKKDEVLYTYLDEY
nr:protein ABIL2-like [Ipomoea batatas]